MLITYLAENMRVGGWVGDDDSDEDYAEDGVCEYEGRDNAKEHKRTPEEHYLTEEEDDDRIVDEVDDDGECGGSGSHQVPHSGAIDD